MCLNESQGKTYLTLCFYLVQKAGLVKLSKHLNNLRNFLNQFFEPDRNIESHRFT